VSLKNRLTDNWRSGCIGAALAAGLGLTLLFSPLGRALVGLSFDLPFAFRPKVTLDGLNAVVIVYMDEKSFQEWKQPDDRAWDRSLHAWLLDWLHAEGCRLVVFDVALAEPGSDEANRRLANAIKSNGRVVLAAILDFESRPGVKGISLVRPLPEFSDVAESYGIAELEVTGTSRVVRRHYPGTEQVPSLPWEAARLIGAELTRQPSNRLVQHWLNYYGPSGTLPNVSYCEITNQPPRYFKDKFVFVGSRPRTGYSFTEREAFRTPYSLWDGQNSSGVEILATAFLNLVRDDWLTELRPWAECLLLIVLGGFFGYGFMLLAPTKATVWAVVSFLLLAVVSVALVWLKHLWFPWLIVGAAQLPTALGWSALCQGRRLSGRKEREPVPAPEATSAAGPAGTRRIPDIPDHELLRPIGRGSYGEVWLARNAIGLFHAVKIVYQEKFTNAAPYEREFRGIQKYMPISRSHPLLVHLLHVGRNDAAGYFFYIMEAADDELTGQNIEPKTYSPKTLAKQLERGRRLPVRECVELGLQLTQALEYLHWNKLIHRDIKPANIIYVKGVPKIADIGLVTDLGSDGDATYLGTEGYIAPEGPGTAAADLYSLGKVMHEASMGIRFPHLPTSLVEKADNTALLELNQIILKACEANPPRRYQCAAEMHADLSSLQGQIHEQPKA
jgi:CHASE2 domain-containing sensor protein